MLILRQLLQLVYKKMIFKGTMTVISTPISVLPCFAKLNNVILNFISVLCANVYDSWRIPYLD